MAQLAFDERFIWNGAGVLAGIGSTLTVSAIADDPPGSVQPDEYTSARWVDATSRLAIVGMGLGGYANYLFGTDATRPLVLAGGGYLIGSMAGTALTPTVRSVKSGQGVLGGESATTQLSTHPVVTGARRAVGGSARAVRGR